MNVEWRDESWADDTSRRTIIVSETSDWALFDLVAHRLATALDGTWIERIDGLDERYWDLGARGGKITSHLQHYLGISLYVAHGLADNDVLSRTLLDEAFDRLLGYDPV